MQENGRSNSRALPVLAGDPPGDVPVTSPHRKPTAYRHEPIGDVVRMADGGDQLAWAELVQRFGPMLMRVARRSGLSAAEAADVQQTTWIQYMRHGGQVRDLQRMGGWLATTARRQSQQRAAGNSRKVPVAEPIDDRAAATGDEVEAAATRHRFDAALETALGRLPDAYRGILLMLSSDDEPSYEEVARAMDLPVGSIGPMRMRGLRMLRSDPVLQRLARDRRCAGQPLSA